MGIKVTINKAEVPENSEYPCLKISRLETLVYFTGPRAGTVLSASFRHVGEYSDDWCEENFEPFSGTVTLKND